MIRTRGFSLVEFMVAITLGLFVSLAVISVFIGSRTAYQATTGTGAVTDGGRFAIDFLEGAVRNSGFMACSRSTSQTSLIVPAASPLLYNFTEGLGGFEAAGTSPGGAGYSVPLANNLTPVGADASAADWVLGLDPALLSPAALVVKNNDVLVVRSTTQNTQPVFVTAIADGTSAFTVTSATGLVSGQYAVISDCVNSLAMQMTGVVAGGGGATITHGAGGVAGTNSTASFLPLSFETDSQVTPVDTVVYYIGPGQDGDGALFSADLYSPPGTAGVLNPTELVADIEAMQLLYGIDTTGSQTVSEYVTADAVPDFNTVMSVKVAVLAASAPGAVKPPTAAPQYLLLGTPVTAPIDTRARQVFETTIAVRNALN